MRYAIFADIHSNLEAFKTVLNIYSREKIDRYFCVGDIVGYGPDPSECIKKITNLNADIVAGNHDWGSCEKFSLGYFNPYAKEAIQWTIENLTLDEKAFLKKLELVKTFQNLTFVHGSLSNPEEFNYIFDELEANKTFNLCKTPVCIIGHSHIPLIFYKDMTESKIGVIQIENDFKIKIEKGNKYLINVGSVGQPRDSNPRACFSIYDTENNIFEIRRVEYPLVATQEKILRAALPNFLAYRLSIGR